MSLIVLILVIVLVVWILQGSGPNFLWAIILVLVLLWALGVLR